MRVEDWVRLLRGCWRIGSGGRCFGLVGVGWTVIVFLGVELVSVGD